MEVFTLIARKKNVALVFVSYLLVALAAISLHRLCTGYFICSSIWTYCISYDNGTEHRV